MKSFKGRKAALQHMLKTGLYSQQDVDLMKEHLNVISKVSDIWTAGVVLKYLTLSGITLYLLQVIPRCLSGGRLRSTKANLIPRGFIANISLLKIR